MMRRRNGSPTTRTICMVSRRTMPTAASACPMQHSTPCGRPSAGPISSSTDAPRAPAVAEVLGCSDADDEAMWRGSLARNLAEVKANPGDPFAWFNLGTDYTALGDFEAAAQAYDTARRIKLPWRMLWYQFGPFRAYYEVGRLQEVIYLADATTKTAQHDESSSTGRAWPSGRWETARAPGHPCSRPWHRPAYAEAADALAASRSPLAPRCCRSETQARDERRPHAGTSRATSSSSRACSACRPLPAWFATSPRPSASAASWTPTTRPSSRLISSSRSWQVALATALIPVFAGYASQDDRRLGFRRPLCSTGSCSSSPCSRRSPRCSHRGSCAPPSRRAAPPTRPRPPLRCASSSSRPSSSAFRPCWAAR